MGRRCGWCGVELRWWQLNHCRICRFYTGYDHPSSPCGQGSRWNAKPDLFIFQVASPYPDAGWRESKKD